MSLILRLDLGNWFKLSIVIITLNLKILIQDLWDTKTSIYFINKEFEKLNDSQNLFLF